MGEKDVKDRNARDVCRVNKGAMEGVKKLMGRQRE